MVTKRMENTIETKEVLKSSSSRWFIGKKRNPVKTKNPKIRQRKVNRSNRSKSIELSSQMEDIKNKKRRKKFIGPRRKSAIRKQSLKKTFNMRTLKTKCMKRNNNTARKTLLVNLKKSPTKSTLVLLRLITRLQISSRRSVFPKNRSSQMLTKNIPMVTGDTDLGSMLL